MRPNKLKKKLRNEEGLVVGTFVFGTDPAVPELLGGLGYDFVILDMEHAAKDWNQLDQLIRACDVGGITPVVRVSALDKVSLALDLGAQGIMLPHVASVADAKAFASALRYPPVGSRGSCSAVRATSYGVLDWMDHQKRSNREVLGIALIEDASAVECAGDIAAVDGIDAVCIGRVDLGASMGLNGLGADDLLLKAVEKITRDVRARGCHVATVIYHPGAMAEWAAKGSRIAVYSQDYKVMISAYRAALEQLR